jgi:biotin carboxylase
MKKAIAKGAPRFLVSIGAGINQLPLIREAKLLGFNVIGVDANTHAAGVVHCDLKIQESAENYGEIYVKLREFIINGDIAGVLSKSYGPSIRTACYLAEKFNITLIPFRRVDDFLRKEQMKKVFAGGGIDSPGHLVLDGRKKFRDIARFSFPLIVKPAVGHAKKGVRLIAGERDLNSYLADWNESQPVLVEEFVSGDEIIAAGIVHRGKYHLADISDKVLSDPPFFVDLAHLSPSVHFGLKDRISAMGQKVADAFEIHTSPLIMEIRITPAGRLYLIEAVPEFGGEFIPDVLIPRRTGYNFIAETIRAATGMEFREPTPRAGKKSVVVKYITGRKGTFLSFSPEKAENLKGIVFLRIFKDIGSEIIPPETNHDRIGVVIAEGRTRGEAVDNADMAVERLNIRIRAAQ